MPGLGLSPWGVSPWGRSGEVSAPILDNQDPSAYQIILPTGDLEFDVVDVGTDASGVDPNTVNIYVDGDLVYNGATNTFLTPFDSGGSGRTTIPTGYHYKLERTSPLSEGYHLILVEAADLDGNEMAEDWPFLARSILPTSDTFPCMDVEGPDLGGLLIYSEISSSRGYPWISFSLLNLSLTLTSNDGSLTDLVAELPISQSSTFEATFKPLSLPVNLDNLDLSRLFFAVYDQQGKCCGMLISQNGVSLIPTFGTSALPIPGSQNLFEDPDSYYTLRLVSDGPSGLMNVYVTKTSELLITGHVLRYTSALFDTPDGYTDEAVIELVGQSTHSVSVEFNSLRLDCTRAQIPNLRPIADAGVDQTATVGATVGYNGQGSYDPEGALLTYHWDLLDTPQTSRFKISGTDGWTVDDGDADGFTTILKVTDNQFSAINAPLLKPGDTLRVADEILTVAETRWIYSSGQWTRDPSLWDDDSLVVTADDLPDDLSSVAWSVLHSSTYFNERNKVEIYGIPDIQGLYEVQLIVNDGQLDSLPSTELLNVASTTVTMGYVPDVSFIWNHLSNFWTLLDDRGKVETVWSGFAQAAAAQLLTAWQIDYNKSLVDIQRVFQRRWLDYSTLLDDDPDTATIRIIRGPIVGADLRAGCNVNGKQLDLILDNGGIESITFSGTDPISATDIATQINDQLGFRGNPIAFVRIGMSDAASRYLSLEYPGLLRIRPVGSANAPLGLSTTAYTQNELQGTGYNLTTPSQVFTVVTPDTLDLLAEDIQAGDVLSATINKWGYLVVRVTSQVDVVVDEVTAIESSVPFSLPSTVTSTVTDFTTQLISAGDLARFELKTIDTGLISTVQCEIVVVRGKVLGFDPLPLLATFDGHPELYETTFLGVRRHRYLVVSPLVQSIPRLQEIIKDPPGYLTQNKDFTVHDEGGTQVIEVVSGTFGLMYPAPDTLWAESTYLDNRPTIENNFGKLVDFTVEDLQTRTDDLDYLSAVRGLWYAYINGPSIDKVRIGTQILLGLPFAEETGTVEKLDTHFSLTEGRIQIRDTKNPAITRTYFYNLKAGLAINQRTGQLIEEGDEILQFEPLSAGVEVLDHKNSPMWAKPYVQAGFLTEIEKFSRFLVRADVDTFNVANMLFAMDFVNKIKPHTQYPLFAFLKNVPETPDEISTVDAIYMAVTMHITTAPGGFGRGAFIWDDFDGAGICNNIFDDTTTPPSQQFIFDSTRLYPEDHIYADLTATISGPVLFDSLWSFDTPIYGPAPTPPPPPPGPEVTVTFDAVLPAGVYTCTRTL